MDDATIGTINISRPCRTNGRQYGHSQVDVLIREGYELDVLRAINALREQLLLNEGPHTLLVINAYPANKQL